MVKTESTATSKDTIPPKLAGRSRVVIEGVRPEIDGGAFSIQRVPGEVVAVEADIFADGHDAVAASLLYRGPRDRSWKQVPMQPLGNDRWQAEFSIETLGEYRYTVEGWVDPFLTWLRDMKKRLDANQQAHVELMAGGLLVAAAAKRAKGAEAKRLQQYSETLKGAQGLEAAQKLALDPALAESMQRYQERPHATRYARELCVTVNRERANFSAWYEIFPRSCAATPGEHGTFKDCERWLPYIASMNFDVLYFPPIHPIGTAFRKGKNNTEKAGPDDVGSPWAIGSAQGGHKAIHPALGTLEDFHSLVARAKEHGLEIALDLAYQCSPDHPYVREHPSFFRKRPDGTIQYAENPPKKYQDIYPLDFETEDWRNLWTELKSIILYWIEQGVRIFRVDNPHTKAFPFWQWVLAEVRAQHPDVIFLAEAFTRPRPMYRLAKLGFTQSYTYFTWRNTKEDLTKYLEELTQTEIVEFFRPNLWPNTPDILHEELQTGGRPAFLSRFVLAATLSSNYGIYGPAFELCVNTPVKPGSEEYLDSEKYQLRHWDVEQDISLRTLIARVNEIRRAHAALQSNRTLRFHPTDNPFLICYSKTDAKTKDAILVAVNMHHQQTHAAWVELDLAQLGLQTDQTFDVHDLLTDLHYSWRGSKNFIQLEPGRSHIFHIEAPARPPA